MPTLDLSSVKGFDPIPDGEYVASVVSCKEKTSQNGNAMFEMAYKVEGGEHDGRQIFDNLTFTPKAMGMVKSKLIALGFPKDFAGEVSAEELIGLTCIIVVNTEKSEEYGDRNRIKRCKPLGDANLDDAMSGIA